MREHAWLQYGVRGVAVGGVQVGSESSRSYNEFAGPLEGGEGG